MSIYLYEMRGNRKRDHDPLPTVRKLLCFGEGAWAALRGAVESVRGGGEEKEEELKEGLIKEIESGEKQGPEYASGEEIFFRRKPWYERQRWEEILDERTRWGDLSIENQKKLIKLIGRR